MEEKDEGSLLGKKTKRKWSGEKGDEDDKQ
jgi:hypothetical protein